MAETVLSHISDHVYWMSPGAPDRPSLCAIVGTEHTLMLDAGASDAHAGLFLDALVAAGVRAPRYVALTHWHWDHVFGIPALDIPVIASKLTYDQMTIQAGYAWTDAALEQRVRSGLEIPFCADNIKLELPEPRNVRIVLPEIVYEDTLTIELGGVTVRMQRVGGDHAADSCVMFIEPDRVLFMGDCLYDALYTPLRHYTSTNLYPLLDMILRFKAERYIEGHNPAVLSRAEIENMARKMIFAGAIVERAGGDEAAALSLLHQETGDPVGQARDEDSEYFVRAFVAGKKLHPDD